MALQAPCSVTQAPLNSGIDCAAKMAAPALFILAPLSAIWQATDEASFLAYILTRIHDVPSKRWFPFFGNNAQIRTLTDAKESDVTVTYDDGSIGFIRNGTFTRTSVTNKGGFAYAQALLSLNKFNGYGLIEVDKFNVVLRRQNADGSFSPLRPNALYGTTPDLSGLKTEFMAGLTVNYSVTEYFTAGVISASTENLLDIMGLKNAQITAPLASTTTILKIGVQTIGTQNDLVAAFPAIASLTVFAVVNKATGVAVVPSAVAIVAGHIELTGVFASGSTFTVSGTTAAALKALAISGYEITQSLDIAIP